MATALTTLANIQAIAANDAFIQALTGSEDIVTLILADVARHITKEVYGDDTEPAQRYCAAHWLSLSNQPVGGRGPLSSINIGGISRSFTLPYLNQKTVYGSTQYGLMFLEYLYRNVVPFYVIVPPPTTEPAQ